MTGIEKISARIAADAREQGQAVLAKSRAEADEITRKYDGEADELRAALTEKAKAEADEFVRRAVGVAELEARKRNLAARQGVIGKAFDGAMAELAALPEAQLVAVLSRLAFTASRKGTEQIVLTPSDHARFGKKVCEGANALLAAEKRTASLTLSASPRALAGGGLVLSDGEVEINCTFETIVSGLRSDISAEVAKILF